MCGIFGFNWQDKILSKKLVKLLKHRGPDGFGIYQENSLTLGHTRLAIIDLTQKGKQPMSNEDQSVLLTFNGEIFNYTEIRTELIRKGHIFKSDTDTEVIIHGYEEYGEKILDKLNGQFAFCIYDKHKQQLFLARDRIGINPLYYYHNNETFIFGSELKVILETILDKKINEFAKNFYLVYGHVPGNETIIEKTCKLLPGHYAIYNCKKNSITITKY